MSEDKDNLEEDDDERERQRSIKYRNGITTLNLYLMRESK